MAPDPAQIPDKSPGGAPPDATGRAGRAGAFSISLFLFAALMLLPPIVTLVEGEANLFGLPVIYLYLFAIWIAVVALIYLISERFAPAPDPTLVPEDAAPDA
ncbi:MAG: hypothetical protein CMM61_01015 [Rhodospirillaceae bacterium]|nr:hypothetical protein [Rhodospirillaceae bacterium]